MRCYMLSGFHERGLVVECGDAGLSGSRGGTGAALRAGSVDADASVLWPLRWVVLTWSVVK